MKRPFSHGLALFIALTVFIISACPQTEDGSQREQSAAPSVETANASVAKTSAVLAAVNFTLSSTVNGNWKVYGTAGGGAALAGITALFNAPILTLSHETDIPEGDYWVTVTEEGKTESARLKLTVAAYTGGEGKSVMPAIAVSTVRKTDYPQNAVVFQFLIGGPDDENAVFTVYSDSAATVVNETVTAELDLNSWPELLILKAAAGDVPHGTYYVTVTETGKTESSPAALIVTQAQSDIPSAAGNDSVTKISYPQAKVSFTLTSTVNGIWKIYDTAGGGTAISDIFVTFEIPLLTLAHDEDVPPGNYWVTVTETNKDESARLRLTVLKSPDEFDGSENFPFQITDEADLRAAGRGGSGDYTTGKYIQWTLDKHYEQTVNIDLSETGDWTPIPANFTGSYDGKGHIITGMIINAPSAGTQAMFSSINDAGTIKNLGLKDINIIAGNQASGIAGSNRGTISNCYTTGSITGIDIVGGIAGRMDAGAVRNCYSTCVISAAGRESDGEAIAAGVVGFCNGGTVEFCFAAGNVISTSINGAAASNSTGGIVGLHQSGPVRNCIALNQKIATGVTSNINVGRVVGKNTNAVLITNNRAWSGMTILYDWNGSAGTGKTISSGLTSVDGLNINNSEAVTQTTWTSAGFIFNANSWKWDIDYMPSLHGEQIEWPDWIYDELLEEGSLINPFMVTDEADLRAVGRGGTGDYAAGKYEKWTLDKYYVQTVSLILSGGNWTPVPGSFMGSYDGKGYTITGLTVNAPAADSQGMFGNIGDKGMVKNLGLIDVNVTGGNNVGGFVGFLGGKVQNCYTTGSVTGTDVVGGIVGRGNAGDSLVQNSYSTCNVIATGRASDGEAIAGGITGFNNGSTIENCFAAGSVSSTAAAVSNDANSTGGISGLNRGPVRNCIALNLIVSNAAAIAANANVGRVAGSNNSALSNNRAWNGMTVTGTGKTINNGLTTVDGQGISNSETKTQSTWTSAGFGFGENSWKWNADKMPSLHGEEIPWPGYLDN